MERYIPTKTERDILTFLALQPECTARVETVMVSCQGLDLNAIERGIEGCVAKGFVMKKDENLTLSPLGKKQF